MGHLESAIKMEGFITFRLHSDSYDTVIYLKSYNPFVANPFRMKAVNIHAISSTAYVLTY